MKLATWNVNSVNARLPRVLEFLETHGPDVVCLQETKCEEAAFPHEALAAAGYRAVDHSTGRWAGVAILARADGAPAAEARGLPGSPVPEEGRWIEATVGGVRVASVYVINGRALDDPMYGAKLAFLDAMARRAAELAGSPLVVCGDFNIAPADIDVYDPAAFAGATHVSEPERERLRAILATGLVDGFRRVAPDTVQHTWWDYRAGHFHKGMGLRIDLVLASEGLAGRLRSCGIDRDFRKGPKPSDHAPVLAEFEPA
ncbi:MAG: exodeoxyribonuclease III [Chloroflexi bacterium]|nr:exodeoxyribonuclease III [Chloroflexota bacterium]